MKKITIMVLLAAPAVSFAGLYGDTPDAKHAWSVHDMNRPNPAKVTFSDAGIPSDAKVLFDGTFASFTNNWCNEAGKQSGWKLGKENDFWCTPGWTNGGNIRTRESFGDCQLHIEWRHEADLTGKGQMRGNSGVFLMSSYEIQVMDSSLTNPADMKDSNYADGQAGAVYAENPPMVNAAKWPGQWQVYDIIFHQPVWEGKKMLHPGSVTVLHNGVVVQDHWEMEGLTTHCTRRALAPHAKKLPLQLQDHGCPVHYRNIWIREIPSRWANTTHSVMSGVTADVMALRRQTAAKLFEKISGAGSANADTLIALAEVISYANEGVWAEKFNASANAYLATVTALKDSEINARKGEIQNVNRNLGVLVRNKVLPNDYRLYAELGRIAEKAGWNKKK